MASPMSSFFSDDSANDIAVSQLGDILPQQNMGPWKKHQQNMHQLHQYRLQHRYHCQQQQQQQQYQTPMTPSPSTSLSHLHSSGCQHDQFFYAQSAPPSMFSLSLPLVDASNEGLNMSMSAYFPPSGTSLGQTAHDQGLPGYPPPFDGYLTGTRASSSQGHCSDAMFPASPMPQASFDSDIEGLFEHMGAPATYAVRATETATSGGLANYYLPSAHLDPIQLPYHLDDNYTNAMASTNEQGTGLALGMLDADDLSQFDTSTAPVLDANNSNDSNTTQLSISEVAAVLFGSHETDMFFSPVDIEAADSPAPIASNESSKSGRKRKRPADMKTCPTEVRKKTKSHDEGLPTSNVTTVSSTNPQDHNADSCSEAIGTLNKALSCVGSPSLVFPTQKDQGSHFKSKHGPYPCLLSFSGGCRKLFNKKNEWKRHCLTQHIVESFYTCTEEGCRGKSDAFFLRKDLFKAHLDRVHTPDDVRKEHKDRQAADKARRDALSTSGTKQRKKSYAPKKTSTVMPFRSIGCTKRYEDTCKKHEAIVKDGLRSRVKLPESITCQAPACYRVFDTGNAFNKYLEHVGKHLERIASGDEADHAFGVELAPYFTAIGILKASHNSSAPWKLVSVNAQTKVEDKYIPDSKLILLGPATPVVIEDVLG